MSKGNIMCAKSLVRSFTVCLCIILCVVLGCALDCTENMGTTVIGGVRVSFISGEMKQVSSLSEAATLENGREALVHRGTLYMDCMLEFENTTSDQCIIQTETFYVTDMRVKASSIKSFPEYLDKHPKTSFFPMSALTDDGQELKILFLRPSERKVVLFTGHVDADVERYRIICASGKDLGLFDFPRRSASGNFLEVKVLSSSRSSGDFTDPELARICPDLLRINVTIENLTGITWILECGETFRVIQRDGRSTVPLSINPKGDELVLKPYATAEVVLSRGADLSDLESPILYVVPPFGIAIDLGTNEPIKSTLWRELVIKKWQNQK